MITRLSTYLSDCFDPHRNLAVEEFLTFHVKPSECILYLWQNKNTVVVGKNQNAWKECNIQKLEEDGGHLVRRLSGGGAVYHDLGNLNFTFCVREEDYDLDTQMDVILRAVQILGIQAEKTGRNDITADGRKFSGNAFYQSGDYCYHHGTLLVDVDQSQMQNYLNVSAEKLRSKGVDSVRSRTVNLKELNPEITISKLKESLIQAFSEVYYNKWYGSFHDNDTERKLIVERICDSQIDWNAVGESEERFRSEKWKYGRRIPFEQSMSRRFSWGEIELELHVTGGKINDVIVYSDAMEQDLAKQISDSLRGCAYEWRQMDAGIRGLDLDSACGEQIKQDVSTLLKEYVLA